MFLIVWCVDGHSYNMCPNLTVVCPYVHCIVSVVLSTFADPLCVLQMLFVY